MSKQELDKAMLELEACRKKILDLRKQILAQKVDDYVFKDTTGSEVSLSDLFGDRDDLIVIHNMGKNCPYCTLWADGFNGVYGHLADRASFVVVSPDPPGEIKEFAESRDWKFRMLSNDGGPFTKDMGYETDDGKPQPGVSTFHRDADGQISRIADTWFGPGDDFCATWHIFDMLKEGVNGWQPKYKY